MAESTGITETFMEVELKPGVHLQIGTNKGWWRVLEIDREKETALLIANTQVAEKSYHDNRESITWENCTLRKWLNEKFYASAFSKKEQSMIKTTKKEKEKVIRMKKMKTITKITIIKKLLCKI